MTVIHNWLTVIISMYTNILFNRAIPQHILAKSLGVHSIHSGMALHVLFNNTGLPLLAILYALIYSTKLFFNTNSLYLTPPPTSTS